MEFRIAKTPLRRVSQSKILLAQCSALQASGPAVYGLEDLCHSLMVGPSFNPHTKVIFLSMLKVFIFCAYPN